MRKPVQTARTPRDMNEILTLRKSDLTVKMKRLFQLILFFGFTAALLTACEEVDEPTVYENWQGRNDAFADSVAALAGNRLVPFTDNGEQIDSYAVGEMFGIQTTASTTEGAQYVYCKKLSSYPENERPLYTDPVTVFYYGTYITGDRFDGNFTGYSAIDTGELDPEVNAPTPFDSPATFRTTSVITGWTAALQYMRKGERWMLYVPQESAYGTTASGNIPAYSTLTFDLILVE